MEAQPAPPATNAPCARPQQPTDSPAAALPTETLVRIFELATEDEAWPFYKQRVRWRFQRVSWQRWTAAGKQRDFALEREREVEGLVEVLSANGRGGVVQSLSLSHELMDGAAAGATTELLRLCSALKKVELQRADRFDFAKGDEEA